MTGISVKKEIDVGYHRAIETGFRCLQHHLTGRRTPLRLSFNSTLDCNFACTYCGILGRKDKDPETADIVRVIDDFARCGGQSFSFFGGEPLLREDIGFLIRRAKSHGLYVSLTTNGWLLPEMIDQVEMVDLFSISFDGDQEVHDRDTRQGSHERCLESFRILQQRGKKFWVLNVLSRKNLHLIDYVLDQADRFGFYIGYGIVQDHSIAGGVLPDGFVAKRSDYDKAIRKIIRAKKQGRRVYSSLTYLRQLLNWPDYSRMFPDNVQLPQRTRCYAADLYAYLDVDGMLYPCLYLADRVKGIDAFKLGFREAFRRLRRDPQCLCSPLSVATCELNLIFDLNPDAVLNGLRVLN